MCQTRHRPQGRPVRSPDPHRQTAFALLTRSVLHLVVVASCTASGTAFAADRPRLGIQPRHPADPGRELLRLPRARQRRPQGRPAARPPRGGHRGRRHRARRPRGERADRPDQRRRSQGADAAAGDHQDADRRSRRTCCKRWIAEGAEYQPHWSLIPPKRPAPADGQGRGRGSATRSTASSWPSSRRTACSPRPRPTAARWPAGSAST